jgi:hypothetical protein
MYSLPLLGATALILLGGPVLVHVTRQWLARAFHHIIFTFHKTSHRRKKKMA